MFSCEHCRTLLLPYLYDAVERDEQWQVKDHLDACPECRQALEKAQTQRGLLADAVKSEFAEVRFAAPADTAKRLAEPTVVLARARRGASSWRRWAVAAALLLAALGASGYAGVAGWNRQQDELLLAKNKHADAQDQARKRDQELERQRKKNQDDIRAIQDQINKLVGDWNQETQKSQQRAVGDANHRFFIQGPKSVQAGGRNEFTIQMPKAAANAKLAKTEKAPKVVARVVDEKKNVLVEQELGDKGEFKFDLPRDLPVKPGAQLALEIQTEGKDAFMVRESLPLLAPEYLTHLTTDRPMYRPGETVRFRSLTLERFSLKPPAEDMQVRYTITGPNGAEVHKAEGKGLAGPDAQPLKGPDGQPLRGIGASEFTLPATLAGGPYTLTVADVKDRFPAEKRTFLVNKWQTPRLNKELHFNRPTYGPGDKVEFQAKATRVAGGPLAHQLVDVRAQVDGNQVAFLQINTDADGAVKGSFALPGAGQMPSGDGIVSLMFHDGAVETLVKPLPIVLKKLRVEFHPEGGDLVADVPNRVYFQVRTTLDKPADLAGRIVDQDGKEAAKIETLSVAGQPQLNQGQGAFTFTPVAGKNYELKIERPSGMEGRYPLPAVRAEGVVLHLPKRVVEQTTDIDAVLHSVGKDRQLLVGAYCRGRLLDHVNVTAKTGQPTPVTLRTTSGVGGVYRLTVFEKIVAGEQHQFVPVAERLLYRVADHKLNVALKADKTIYAPGQTASITVQSTDEKNQAKPAVLLVYAADLSVLKLADDKTARLMPTHFHLTREVQKPEDLENADFLLGDHPQAHVAVDLLLGTQGWRRFAEQDPAQFQKRQPAEASRVLLAMAQKLTPDVVNPQAAAVARVDEQFSPKFVGMQKKLAEEERQEVQVLQETVEANQARAARDQTARARIALAEENVRSYRFHLATLGMIALMIVVLAAGLICIAVGARRASQGGGIGFILVGACLLVVLFVGGVGTMFFSMSRTMHEVNGMRGPAVVMEKEERMGKDKAAAMEKLDQPLDMAEIAPQAMPAPRAKMGGAGGFPGGFAGKVPLPGGPMGGGPAAGPQGLVANNPVDPAMPPDAFGGIALDLRDQFAADRNGRPKAANLFDVANADRQLRQQGKFQEMLRMRLGREVAVPTGQEPFVVREFAHRHQRNEDGLRSDFTETLLWHPALVLIDGSGKVSFDLSDSVTRFQVVVLAHSLDGRLGASTLEIVSKLPFSLDLKVPVEVTSSDKLIIPIEVSSDEKVASSVRLDLGHMKGLKILNDPDAIIGLKPGKSARHLFRFEPIAQGQPTSASLRIIGASIGPDGIKSQSDKIERTFSVVPDGFPIAKSVSGLLEKSASHEIDLPVQVQDMVPGSLTVKLSAYPSTLAELQKGLDAMLREPCGCFEQSSSSNYPNVLILNYLRDTRQTQPQLEERTRRLLQDGYQKLTSFECRAPADQSTKRGYEWFGQTAPPHEALTAYGLLQFRDMAKVFPVDDKMVERSRKYLLDQRDNNGGFKRNPQALDSFGRAPDHITNAYIVWALASSGTTDLDKELTRLIEQAKDAKLRDPYFLSLVSLACLHSGKAGVAVDLLKDAQTFQKEDGRIGGARVSITGSAERDLDIETTALTLLAWLQANRPESFNPSVQKAAKWIGQQRGGFGGFGGTQATILALKSLIAFTRDNQKQAEAGELRLFVGDEQDPAVVKAFAAGATDNIELALPAERALPPGKTKLRFEVTGNTTFPYTLAWTYNAVKPANVDNCPVHLTTTLKTKDAKEGETVRLTATVENKTGKGQGMAVAIIGLPGGLALPEDMAQLKKLAQLQEEGTKPGAISFWELKGRELVLYWRDLAPDAKITVNLDLVCRLPGEYRGPASRAYLYYNGDRRFWTDPLAINIQPQD